MHAPGVYAIVNGATERTYIGIAVDMAKRWNGHRCRLRSGKHCNVGLQADWTEHGERMFAFVPLEVVEDFKQRIQREQVHINAAHHAYNISTNAGPGPRPGCKLSPDRVEKLRAALRGKPKSPEHRARLSAAKKGVPNPAHSARMKGRKQRPESIEKMRLTRIGVKMSPESSERKRLALTGRVFSQDWKDKISASKTGKPWSALRRMAFLQKRETDQRAEET